MTKRAAKDDRRKFLWLDQVKADNELPSSAFVVAFELMQGFNAEYGGACWKSIDKLAEETGLSEPSIVRITRQLAERGHLRIEPGKAGRGGRGHSNRYFMAEKTSAGGAFSTEKTSAGGAFKGSGKGSAGESKGSASGVDLTKTLLTEEANASSGGERERSHSLADTPGAPAPNGGAPKEGFDALFALWSAEFHFADSDEDEARAWRAYATIVPAEAGPGELHARAVAHIAAVKARGLSITKLWRWLERNNWRKDPPPPPTPKRGQRESTAGSFVLRRYGDRS